MGKFSRSKGLRAERELVGIAQEHGIPARRVPLSGAQAGYPDDVILGPPGDEQRVEVKARANGFALLYGALEDALVVAFRSDRKGWLVALTLDDFLALRFPGAPPPEAEPIHELAEAVKGSEGSAR